MTSSVSPETLVRHELVGLPARVVDASNPDLVGIEGRVVEETMRTLGIETDRPEGASSVKRVPKGGTTFEFRSEPRSDQRGGSDRGSEGGCSGGGPYVTVEGKRLVERPARRTERGGDSKWR